MEEIKNLTLKEKLDLNNFFHFVFKRNEFRKIEIDQIRKKKINHSFSVLQKLIENGTPIYGVTTGFGDSCHRYVRPEVTDRLQVNLINYLSCGTGPVLPKEASRAMFLVRLNSLSQGHSGVSLELIDHMKKLLEEDIIPVVPREGSLGASGDLVPLAYLGQTIQGQGKVFYKNKIEECKNVFTELNIQPYKLKAKEGLAIVNGTSTMAGLFAYNVKLAKELVRISEVATSWLCLALGGRREAFSPFINEVAKSNPGQKLTAGHIDKLLSEENYFPKRGQEVGIDGHFTNEFVQDRYSLRCVPQILGPVRENLNHCFEILFHEINSITDNPVINLEDQLEMGGNFYGGYLSQGMDYLKINLAQIADLLDRQVALIIDDKSNRGLPPNLANYEGFPEEEKHIHHGLKGVHQAVSAITSEVMQKSIPSSIFSRSSESHNQDKVSLGMGASSTCFDMLEMVYKLTSMQLICFAQALDLKKIEIIGSEARALYDLVRFYVPFVKEDSSLGIQIEELALRLKFEALNKAEDIAVL